MAKELDVVGQSKNAYNQWKDIWRENCEKHRQFKMKPLSDFKNSGIGKAVLCVGNGHSFEEEIKTIQKYQDNVDIFACDKTLGLLLDRGIAPTFCMVCDANVNYEKYLKPYEDKLKDTTLFINVCANTKWSENGNWKDKYFFVNEDAIQTEKEFSQLSGCQSFIPAATNVSNAMIVMLTQSTNKVRQNYFGYDKVLTIGFDYGWRPQKYYAFNHLADGKDSYMRHIHTQNHRGELYYSSNNLNFSSQWLQKYVSTFGLPVITCTKNTIVLIGKYGKLEEQMQYRFKPQHAKEINDLASRRAKLDLEIKSVDMRASEISLEHYYNYRAT